MPKFLSLLILWMSGFTISVCQAQESKQLKKSPFGASIELTTKYMWRGQEYGTSPTVFPTLSYTFGGFNAFAMGAYAWDGSHQEVDLGFSYTYKSLTIGAVDYFYPSKVGSKDSYFNFKSHETGHSIETYLTFVPENIPFYLNLSTFIFGADKKLNGSQAYSSYAEVGYNHSFSDDNNLSLALGAALNKSFYTDYDKGFNIVNIAIKYSTAFKLGNFKLPISASYIFNPYKEKSYFTFSTYFGI